MNDNGQAEPLLVAEQVRKVYRTGGIQVEALAGLDLMVRRGELVAVMGPSGSGKTTLLNCLSGLDDIDGGRVLVAGQDLFVMSDARRTAHRATSMGFIFQAFNLIPVFTAAENVELPLLLNGVPTRRASGPRRARTTVRSRPAPPRPTRNGVRFGYTFSPPPAPAGAARRRSGGRRACARPGPPSRRWPGRG